MQIPVNGPSSRDNRAWCPHYHGQASQSFQKGPAVSTQGQAKFLCDYQPDCCELGPLAAVIHFHPESTSRRLTANCHPGKWITPARAISVPGSSNSLLLLCRLQGPRQGQGQKHPQAACRRPHSCCFSGEPPSAVGGPARNMRSMRPSTASLLWLLYPGVPDLCPFHSWDQNPRGTRSFCGF